MRNILVIAKREWRNYFTNPTGFVFSGLLLVVCNWMFFTDLFVINQADLRSFWSVMIFLLSIFVPAISMGLLADEKKNGTWEVLLSLPVNETQLVVGKFLGCSLYLLFTILLSLPTIITVFFLGRMDAGVVAGGLLGVIILGMAYLAVGILFSSLSNQAIVGFLGATIFLIINNLLGQELLLSRLPGAIKDIVGGLSLSYRGSRFGGGLLELNDLVFFGSWIFIFLTLTVLALKARDK